MIKFLSIIFSLFILFNSLTLHATQKYIEYKRVEDMKFLKGTELIKPFSYGDLFIYDENYIMVDSNNRFFDIYSKNGNFIAKINFENNNLSHKSTNFIINNNQNLVTFDNKTSQFYIFSNEGKLIKKEKIKSPTEKTNRINDIDAKVYHFSENRVYLDFINKIITIANGPKIQTLKYEQLNSDCYIMKSGDNFYLKNPKINNLIDIKNNQVLYTGEIVLEDKNRRTYVLNKSKEEISIFFEKELISYLAPSDNQGPFCYDMALFKNDDLAILDERDCRIYIYNKEGMKIRVFGTRGNKKGELKKPVSIVVDGADRIIIKDDFKEAGIVFDKQGNFIMEMKDLLQSNLPKNFRIFLDLDNRIHIVDFYQKLHFSFAFSFSYMKEIDRIFSSIVRYPRKYMSLNSDGNILYFDSGRNIYEILKRNGKVESLKVGKTLSQFNEKKKISFKSITMGENYIFMLSNNGKLYKYNEAEKSIKFFPFKQKIEKIAISSSGYIHIITKNKRLFKLNKKGEINYSHSINKLDYKISSKFDKLFVCKNNSIKILDDKGKLEKRLKLSKNSEIIKAYMRNDDKLYIFYKKNGFLGLFKFKKKNSYLEAMRYFNNGLFKMSAVRLEKLLEKGIDNPQLNYKLYICYRKLNKFELSEKIARHIKNRWPNSKEANKI
jgi:hypothetical protein